jgi:hypothetical protein
MRPALIDFEHLLELLTPWHSAQALSSLDQLTVYT